MPAGRAHLRASSTNATFARVAGEGRDAAIAAPRHVHLAVRERPSTPPTSSRAPRTCAAAGARAAGPDAAPPRCAGRRAAITSRAAQRLAAAVCHADSADHAGRAAQHVGHADALPNLHAGRRAHREQARASSRSRRSAKPERDRRDSARGSTSRRERSASFPQRDAAAGRAPRRRRRAPPAAATPRARRSRRRPCRAGSARVEQQHVVAALAEEDRGGRARGAAADHDHVARGAGSPGRALRYRQQPIGKRPADAHAADAGRGEASPQLRGQERAADRDQPVGHADRRAEEHREDARPKTYGTRARRRSLTTSARRAPGATARAGRPAARGRRSGAGTARR